MRAGDDVFSSLHCQRDAGGRGASIGGLTVQTGASRWRFVYTNKGVAAWIVARCFAPESRNPGVVGGGAFVTVTASALFDETAARARAEGRLILTEEESKAILQEQGVRVTIPTLATSADEAAAAAQSIGFPVVMKVSSREITHKSDVGGVRLDIGDAGSARTAFDEIMASAKAADPNATIDGVSVQAQAPGGGVEVIVGMTRDQQFGPVIMFGLGGIAVEVLQDVAFRIAPLTKRDAGAIIREIKGYQLLTGYRATQAVDLGALEGVIEAVSAFVSGTPDIAEMDLNPVLAYSDRSIAVDARIVLTADSDS